MKAAEQPFVEYLGRAVERAVVVGVVALGGGEPVGHAVDRGRGSRHDLGDLGLHGLLCHVERAIDQDFEGQTRILGALRDADGGLMEDDVDTLHDFGEELAVADVAFDHGDEAARNGASDVFSSAPDEVIEDDDFFRRALNQQVGDVGADQAGATGN